MLYFAFGDRDSRAFGIQVATRVGPPSFKRRVQYVCIPGRKSSLWIDEKVYDDAAFDIPCSVAEKTPEALSARLQMMLAWFLQGERDLSLSWLPLSYKAHVTRTPEIQIVQKRAALLVVPFVCRPPFEECCEDD